MKTPSLTQVTYLALKTNWLVYGLRRVRKPAADRSSQALFTQYRWTLQVEMGQDNI